MQQVSSALVQSRAPDKVHLHNSLLRNQLLMPKLKDSISTIPYLRGLIGFEVYWTAFCVDVRVLNCPDPPSKQEIAMELVTVMRNRGNPNNNPELEESFQRTATEIRRVPPNATYMLALLSTLYPEHKFFKKDWVKPVVRPNGVSDPSLVLNPGGFWDGLPTASKKKRGRGINYSNKETLEQ